ncbi:hypothetical protein AHAS_Ahas07G0111100 [Arachis hypogaea]
MLNLSYNPFSPAPILLELGNLMNLEVLWLTQCNLIPESLGNLKSLVDFDLPFNNLHGSIPASLTGLTLLVQLELYNNSLSGELPKGKSNLTSLRLVDLSMDQFH